MPPEQNLVAGSIYEGRLNTDLPRPEPQGRDFHYVPNTPPQLASENIIRPINIRQLSHGYVVEVGCQILAIESASTLIAKLSEYILNPNATEQKHKEGKLF